MRSCGIAFRVRHDLFGREEEAMAGLAHHAEVLAGVVFEHEGEMHGSLGILLHGFDHRGLAREKQVDGVRAPFWMNADVRSGGDPGSTDLDAVESFVCAPDFVFRWRAVRGPDFPEDTVQAPQILLRQSLGLRPARDFHSHGQQ